MLRCLHPLLSFLLFELFHFGLEVGKLVSEAPDLHLLRSDNSVLALGVID